MHKTKDGRQKGLLSQTDNLRHQHRRIRASRALQHCPWRFDRSRKVRRSQDGLDFANLDRVFFFVNRRSDLDERFGGPDDRTRISGCHPDWFRGRRLGDNLGRGHRWDRGGSCGGRGTDCWACVVLHAPQQEGQVRSREPESSTVNSAILRGSAIEISTAAARVLAARKSESGGIRILVASAAE